MHLLLMVALLGMVGAGDDAPRIETEMVFPPQAQHNHAPGIVECPNGDLLASWYRGSGERSADDVMVLGARKKKGESAWSEPFVMADYPGFPDCNTCMMIDGKGRLWLFWPLILANTWESCLTNFRVSSNYQGPGAPRWEREGIIPLKPADFHAEALKLLEERLAGQAESAAIVKQAKSERLRERLGEKLYQRLGWQPRCKPTVLPSGRILLPLYTDTYSISLMAVSDDGGQTWYASKPLIGFGNIQPAVLRRNDGTLVAYMRENGPLDRIRVSESKDDGITWGKVGVTNLPNPGSGLDGVRLANGRWVLIYNDSTKNRSTLAVSLSDDEGKTWKWTRHLEKHASGSYHYPALIEGRDGTIHAIYSHFVRAQEPKGKELKTMKHAAFNEAWIRAGDG